MRLKSASACSSSPPTRLREVELTCLLFPPRSIPLVSRLRQKLFQVSFILPSACVPSLYDSESALELTRSTCCSDPLPLSAFDGALHSAW